MIFPVRIIHEEHGAMHVYSADELARHQERGWVVEAPAETIVVEPVQVAKPRGRPRKAGA